MSTSSSGRNDPCPCGSGKKFKKCCLRRQDHRQAVVDSQNAASKIKLREIRSVLDQCLVLHDYVSCVFWLFGISVQEAPLQAEMLQTLVGLREEFAEAEARASDPRKTVVFTTNPDELLEQLRSVKVGLEANKELWKSGLIEIRCSDEELRSIALKIKDEGRVCFSKSEFDQRFNRCSSDPFWRFVPDYTLIFLGGGMGISSPEYDMFRAMCCCHDRAVLTGRQLEKFRQLIVNNIDDRGVVNFEELDADERGLLNLERLPLRAQWQGFVHFWELGEQLAYLTASHLQEVRQAVVDACLFVEAFINAVAHAYRSNPAKSLSPEEDLYLQERAIDRSTGAPREKFVSLQDKLCRWVELISPRGETFDKGANPYQSFRTIQGYRDSIVHLSSTKAEKYRRIDLGVANQAVDVALQVVQSICQYIAPSLTEVAYPKWLVQRRPDGLFNLWGSIDIFPKKSSALGKPSLGRESP
jgi:hypothetical protein